VEDNADMRAYLRESLEGIYRVLEAEDGEQGLHKGTVKMPDLIISDVMMPKMDGFELCRKLKNNECTSHIPVILLTARADAESKIEGLETGADDYLSKPFDARELRVRVKNLIELRRKLWEKFRQGSTVEPHDIALTSIDAQFLERAIEVVEVHIAESGFGTETFGREIGLSRSHLNHKLRTLTGQSTHQFIRTLRLKRAAQLLKCHTGNVSEIAYEVGFYNLSHFSRVFREMFGLTPSEYAARHSERKS
jgi:DNA-binding response OmpR family regulator